MSVRQLGSGKWQVDVYGLDGHRARRTFRTKRIAEQIERKMLDARDRGEQWDDTTTLAMFIPVWEATVRPGLRSQTWKGYNGHVRRYILPELGATRLHRVTTPVAQRFVSTLAANGLGGQTTRRVYATLSSIMRTAARQGAARPLDRRQVEFPVVIPFTPRVPSIVEIEDAYERVAPQIAAAIPLAGYMGLRWGEVFGLHKSAVDWKRRRIRVHHVLEQAGGKLVEATKSGRQRWVTMPARVADALESHIAEYPHPRLVFSVGGKPVRSRWFYEQWSTAELDFTFHGLRHAAPTIMAEAGWSIKRVSVELGHASAAFTMDRYGHLWPESEERDRERLDDLISARTSHSQVNPSDSERSGDTA